MNKEKVVDTLKRCWSKETSSKWAPDNPAQGQCSVTALVIQNHFGGQLLKTKVDGLWHFNNKIEGVIYDFTDSQFTEPILYENEPASRAEALSGTSQEQYAQLNYPRLEGEGFYNILSTEVDYCFDEHSCSDKEKSQCSWSA